MYATVRRYEGIDLVRSEEITRKVGESLLPSLSKLPVRYLVGTPKGRLTRDPEGEGSYSASGIYGDATQATRQKGEVVVRAIAIGTVDWEARLVAAFHRLSRTPERVASDPKRSDDEWANARAG